MRDLRKVTFTLEGQEDLGYLDYETEEERENATKQREGFFHCWGNEVNFVDGKQIERVVGIVEENETHKIYHVTPKRIIFACSEE